MLEKRSFVLGKYTYVLDGDNVRHDLNRNLRFAEAGRVENVRWAAEMSKLMEDAGLIVLVSFTLPFIAELRVARGLFAQGEFVEAFVDASLEA